MILLSSITERGVVSESIVSEGERLVHANEILSRVVDSYKQERLYKQRQYTLRISIALLKVLGRAGASLPPDWKNIPDGVSDCLDLFIGYIMLDALIANQDRHHENWGFILSDNNLIYLAPTYDHASSLGRNESDETRVERLNTKDRRRGIGHSAAKAQSAFFDVDNEKKRVGTVEVFALAALKSKKAGRSWLDRLRLINENSLDEIFSNIPSHLVSKPAIAFAKSLVLTNKQRLLATME